MGHNFKDVMLITANIGSTFEYPERLFPIWIENVVSAIKERDALFVAIHCQEVGGKNYEDSMQYVDKFMKMLLTNDDLVVYNKARIYLDEDFTIEEKFTALGSIYFIHEAVANVEIWDFVDLKFITVEGREVFSANIEDVPHKMKEKFPLSFFPEKKQKWSRKGFIQTRWKIFDVVLDFVNIHLFHDICNILPLTKDPEIYSSCRNKALHYSLSRITKEFSENLPLFIFGDFNFRLSCQKMVKKLIEPRSTVENVYKKSHSKNEEIIKVVYRDNLIRKIDDEENEGTQVDSHTKGRKVLEVGRKLFDIFDKTHYFLDKPIKMFREFDEEPNAFFEYLFEFKIEFPPSYPFSEDEDVPLQYMNTRCPSWCDRVFVNTEARRLIADDLIEYQMIGLDSCMGDHKPIFLTFRLNDRGAITPRDGFHKTTTDPSLLVVADRSNHNECVLPHLQIAPKSILTIIEDDPLKHRRKYNSVVNDHFLYSHKRQSVVDCINGMPASLLADLCNQQWNIFDNAKFDKETELDLKFRLSHRPYGSMFCSVDELSSDVDVRARSAHEVFLEAARSVRLAENVVAAFRQSTNRKRKISDSSSEEEEEVHLGRDAEVNDANVVFQTNDYVGGNIKATPSESRRSAKRGHHRGQCCIMS